MTSFLESPLPPDSPVILSQEVASRNCTNVRPMIKKLVPKSSASSSRSHNQSLKRVQKMEEKTKGNSNFQNREITSRKKIKKRKRLLIVGKNEKNKGNVSVNPCHRYLDMQAIYESRDLLRFNQKNKVGTNRKYSHKFELKGQTQTPSLKATERNSKNAERMLPQTTINKGLVGTYKRMELPPIKLAPREESSNNQPQTITLDDT